MHQLTDGNDLAGPAFNYALTPSGQFDWRIEDRQRCLAVGDDDDEAAILDLQLALIARTYPLLPTQ